MLIGIEGLDRTGKTTLARQLVDETGAKYLHFDKPKQHPLIEYLKPIEREDNLILDRYHWGERVWPTIFNRPTEYDDVMHHYVELALKSRGAGFIHAIRPVEEIIHACHVDEEPVNADQVLHAARLFSGVYQDSILERRTWTLGDYTGHMAESAKVRFSWCRKALDITRGWVGEPIPDVLLVGEQVGPGGQGDDWILPFVPFKNTSGYFLMSELLHDRALARNVAICNAHTPDDRDERILALWEELGMPPVVALGARAHAACLHCFPCCGTVPHPQYVRRFLRKHGPGWYLEEIKKAMEVCE